MTLPASGTISLSAVNVELSKAANAAISLNDANVRALAGIASGTISLASLYGKSAAATISLSNATVSSFGTDTLATSTYTLSNTGDITKTIGGDTNGTTDLGDWITPKSGMSAYECLATVTSGTLSSGTAGTWLNLGTSQSWSQTKGGGTSGVSTCVFTLQIRQVGQTAILATATITLTAETEAGGVVMTL